MVLEGSSTPTENDSVVDTIRMLRSQEESGYRTYDYLHHQRTFPPTCDQSELHVNAECRSRMVDWCYQIIDYCDYRRETVAVAVSCLDRFLCSPGGCEIQRDRNLFQLATMAALYTSIKTQESEAMSPTVVARLSRGLFSKEQVTVMEFQILTSLQWRVNPPTALTFVDLFLCLIPDDIVSQDIKEKSIGLAKYQTELSMGDSYCIGIGASAIALASLINSLERLNLDRAHLERIQCALSDMSSVESRSRHFHKLRLRLFKAMTGQLARYGSLTPRPGPHKNGWGALEKRDSNVKEIHRQVSPRSVSVPMRVE